MNDYRDILALLHRTLKPRLYLEIGVGNGDSQRLVQPPTRIISIDPNSNSPAVCYMTSDEFFGSGASKRMIGSETIDLAFIDGHHEFMQALRDFSNIAAHCSPYSLIAIHDTLPNSADEADPEPQTATWTGDVWKIIPALTRYKLNMVSISAPPAGLTLVCGVTPEIAVEIENAYELVEQFAKPMTYAIYERMRRDFTMIEPTDQAVLNWLAIADV